MRSLTFFSCIFFCPQPFYLLRDISHGVPILTERAASLFVRVCLFECFVCLRYFALCTFFVLLCSLLLIESLRVHIKCEPARQRSWEHMPTVQCRPESASDLRVDYSDDEVCFHGGIMGISEVHGPTIKGSLTV